MPDISSMPTISVMIGTYSMKLAWARIALRSLMLSPSPNTTRLPRRSRETCRREYDVEQEENGEIEAGDDGQLHVRLPHEVSFRGAREREP